MAMCAVSVGACRPVRNSMKAWCIEWDHEVCDHDVGQATRERTEGDTDRRGKQLRMSLEGWTQLWPLCGSSPRNHALILKAPSSSSSITFWRADSPISLSLSTTDSGSSPAALTASSAVSWAWVKIHDKLDYDGNDRIWYGICLPPQRVPP